jgi:ElaB/YqjD/DUF883 family membrane-anchored ribosome-binding protein
MASDPVETAAAAADDARHRVTATIDEIHDRLDPRRIATDAFERLTASSRALATQAGDVAKAHPIAIGTAVAALGLALLARNRLANATVNLGDGTADYTDYDDDYDEPAKAGSAAPARFNAFDAPERDQGVDAPAWRQGVAEQAGDAVQANPGVSILIGLAAGAALGALLPTSEGERRTLGETGSRLSAAARAAARRASDELDAAGLSVDNVRSMAGEATKKAKSAAMSVVDAAKAELKA